MFDGVRHFIIEEGRPVTLANDFIAIREYPLLGEMMNGSRPDGWVGHILAADTSRGSYRAHVQLFVSKDWPAPAYTVQLPSDATDEALRTSGHAYVYFPEGRRGKFSGKAHALHVERMATDFAADQISLDRCRELLGDEAAGLSDEEVGRIRQHAETLAHVLIQVFLEDRSTIQ